MPAVHASPADAQRPPIRSSAALDYDPLAPDWRDDPFPQYRKLRDTAPVFRSRSSKVICVSRYDDVFSLLNDPARFSSRAMSTMLMNQGREGPPPLSLAVVRLIVKLVWRARMRPARFASARMLIAEDGDTHSQLRAIVNRGFTPRGVASLEARVREVAQEQVAGLRRGEPFDVVHDLAVPLPVRMICEILGIEPERRADFKRWSDTVIANVSTIAGHSSLFSRGMVDVFVEMVEYLKGVCAARRANPTGDLISTIVTGESSLDDYDVVQFVMLLLIAGNETTTNLIGNAVDALLDHPEQLEQLAAHPELVGAAIEEVLRFDSPIQLIFRTATEDIELHGETIPKGAIVAPLLGSANRDERRFPDPDRFDIERRPQAHVAFGFGKHFCLGASLARLEARCALEALLPELPRLRRAAPRSARLDSFLVRGPRSIAVVRAASR